MMVESLASLAAYCALMSGTPGPNNVMLATSGANFGFRRTLPYLLGVNVGVFSLTYGISLGVAAMFSQYSQLQEVLKIAGGLHIVYLSWKLAGAGAVTQPDVQKPLSFLDGAVFQLDNPKTRMRAATISTVFLPPTLSSAIGALYVSGLGFDYESSME